MRTLFEIEYPILLRRSESCTFHYVLRLVFRASFEGRGIFNRDNRVVSYFCSDVQNKVL